MRRYSPGRGRRLTRYEQFVERLVGTRFGAWLFLHVLTRIDPPVLRLTGGRASFTPGAPIGLLETTGARSGARRRTALLYLADGDDAVVIASNGGQSRHPAWLFNVRKQPQVRFLARGDGWHACTAHEAAGEERDRLWAAVTDLFAGYGAYAERAGGREIPLVVLRPSGPVRRAGARRILDPLTEFLHAEAAGGIVLLIATLVALLWANLAPHGYEAFWHEHVDVGLDLDLHHWVNDGLMAIFFFVVGLEIKRELVTGELRDRRAATLPVLAAAGGVALPAVLFAAVTAGTGDSAGWAIPAATDIAFAVGVLALLGDRVAPGLKLFLLTIAIVDDIAAIVIIAVFYSDSLSGVWGLVALAGLGAVLLARRFGVTAIAWYVLLGVIVWLGVHESGVHATIAGVALGLLTPTGEVGGRDVLGTLEHRLHPVSSFVIVPLFALANAGIYLGGGELGDAFGSRLAWAIIIGLFVGKLLGILAGTLGGLRANLGALPGSVPRRQLPGMSALGGIGFTVSLFIAQLAFSDPERIATAKVGVLAGSLASGVLGTALLLLSTRRR